MAVRNALTAFPVYPTEKFSQLFFDFSEVIKILELYEKIITVVDRDPVCELFNHKESRWA